MVDRFWVWLGTGVVTAGISAALLAGAGVATATEGDSADGGGTKTSESSDPGGNKNDPGAGVTPGIGLKDDGDQKGDVPAGQQPNVGDVETDDNITDELTDDLKDEELKDEDVKDEDVKDELIDESIPDADGDAGEIVDTVEQPDLGDAGRSNDGQDESQSANLDQTLVDDLDVSLNSELDDVERNALFGTKSQSGEEHALVPLTTEFEELTKQTEIPEFAPVAFSAPAAAEINSIAAARPLNIVLDVIGTIVFGLYGFVTRLIGGPPVLPPNSTVTVYSSRLRIDCGCAPGEGEEVPVDWYIPENPDPDRIIYLQHGFLAAGPWYSYTAATLAEQTNSIVVAPSITSNFLAYDQCWLGGAPMHQAMAGLFDPNNTALEESLGATPYEGELKWKKVVLMGHSLGGGAVSGIAGYMTDAEIDDRLAGVVLLDGVGLNGQMVSDLQKVDSGIPIYQLAAPKYMWNMFGSGTDALIAARPDAPFYGVTLAGGSHVDTMRGGNFLIQFSQQLVAGFSTPQNVSAAEILMVGWVNDMFDGDRAEGIYLDSGETRTIDTPAGQATLVDLPNSLRRPYLLNFLEPLMAMSGGLFTLQPGCLREPTSTAAGCAGSVAA
ncbi:alpha/beta hydrolase [Mycobacterium sp. 29Ha]|uniref:alpha/beta hydrolase family protein n=1 Tax=Mycobacterium sp. 29Ha TaxID=2939268 RepID=UPI0029390801|nr:alpha/beta hydrolase [Mycobacterium sp. 29Ha]MDV3134658.1 alpha/beta hydrolase [Mycobacterium sp. 29Ha]